jgi:trimeric autotransporter adhesin
MLVSFSSLHAQAPRTFSYQGVLTDGSGTFIPDGNHSLTIRLYETASGGSAVYEESQNVAVIKGIFNTVIGSITPIPDSLPFDRAYFLGVSIDGGTELVPRTAMSAAPYALFAKTAGVADSLSSNVTGVVISVNNQSGKLAFQGTGSTTVTNVGDVFTINSSDGSSSKWDLSGNTATDPAIHFIGTTDNKDIVIRTNNIERFRITANGTMHPTLRTGDGNTYMGFDAGMQDTGATNSTAFGYRALSNLRMGSGNTAVGYESQMQDTNSIGNTSLGVRSLYSHISGNYNTAIGDSALFADLTGNSNTAVGAFTLVSNTSGSTNTASGTYALYSNTTGGNNTASGVSALRFNTTGNTNTGFGAYALYLNTEGTNNTASGYFALRSNTTGASNTAYGASALYFNTTGEGNTSIGCASLVENITGHNNTAIGFSAGSNGSGFSNTSAVGYQTTTTASNQVRVGNSSVTSIGGQVGWTTLSDERVKNTISEGVAGLDFIMKLHPVTYRYDVSKINTLVGRKDVSYYPGKNDIEKITFSGFLAQEVEQAAKSAGYDFSGVDLPKNDKDLYGIRYGDFVVPLVKAMQEQQGQINSITSESERVRELEQTVSELQQRLEILEQMLRNQQPVIK